MPTVQTKVTDYQDLVPFFYLRITGLPFYVFATVNPSDSRYGSFAWSAPTGYPSTWAQRGLDLPDDTIEQKLPDIIGGVASPGRCRLSVTDFADPTHPGFGYFSRLFAAGRTLSDSSIPNGYLSERVVAVPAGASTVFVDGANASFPSTSDIYIGAETIGISTANNISGGSWALTIADRNKYVCFGNSADGGTYWPPTPYHRTGVNNDGTAVLGAAPIVAGDVMDVLGRTAALWMGHMRPDGNPEPESSSACLLLGRVSGIEIGKVGGMFDITIDSITADLTKAIIAPDLPHATIEPGIYVRDVPWCSFYLGIDIEGTKLVSITPGNYQLQDLANAVTAAIAALFTRYYVTLQLVSTENGTAFQFVSSQNGSGFSISSVPTSVSSGANAAPAMTSLLYALGFDPTTVAISAPTSGTSLISITAPRGAATVFIPTGNQGTGAQITLLEPDIAAYFFSNQQDGSGSAWGKLGDGQIVQVAGGGAGNTVFTGKIAAGTSALTGADATSPNFGKFYYVDPGQIATIDQIVMFNSQTFPLAPSFTHFLGGLLASTTGLATDNDLNLYPEGVGLGWVDLMTASDWAIADESGVPRVAYIDASTTFASIFTPYAREHGLFIMWDPSGGRIRLRRFQIPTQAGASASGTTNVVFTESNRAKESDRTSQRSDRSSLRTSWKIQPAFSPGAILGGWRGTSANIGGVGVNKPQPVVIVDVRARSMYPNDARQEEIDDPTLMASATLGDTISQLIRLYGSPWTLCQRSMNKRGMLLAPGTIHQIVDNTMVNPFTGATGITSNAAVYCFLSRVAMNPSTGDVTIEFMINSSSDQSLYRQWSPSALVDFNLNTGGYTHGYNSGTKQLSTVQHYGASASGDGADFAIGDTIRIIQRDNSQAPITEKTDTVAGVSGGVLTLTTGVSALATDSESVVILQKYNSATATRQNGATRVSWQGDGSTRTIQGNATVRLNRYA